MIRALVTAALCAVAIIAGDMVFRTSLLQQVRPIILVPTDRAVVDPPVQVRWEGLPQMRVLLSIAGGKPRDLGVHASPFTIPSEAFPRDAGYQVEIRSLRFGEWIRAARWFQVHPVPEKPAREDRRGNQKGVKDLLRTLAAARRARDKAQDRTKFLREENAALRDESARLAKQLETLYRTQEEDAQHAAELEQRLSQLAEEYRAVVQENAAIRQRLSGVVPCTVWGYYSYQRPQAVPVARRLLMVSDARGRVFRLRAQCAAVRRGDVTAASICFCVGNSFGG
ncbi:MAG: hypothetical protein ACE5I7_10505 [Candidatus Binatia bacterium]